MTTLKLSACHNWCDRRCERCPLWRECPVSTSQITMTEALEQAVTMIEQVCRDEGIDTDALPPPPPPGPTELALQRAALEWARTYSAIVGWDATALVVVGKLARIASEGAMNDDDLRAADLNLNVMLVEQLLANAGAVLGPWRASAPSEVLAKFDEADQALRVFLAPFSAAIPASDRAALGALVASGRAPSPFPLRSLPGRDPKKGQC
jgi:hypothetical protein